MVETIEKGVLGMFYPKILMKEFYIVDENDIILGKTIVRYKNGTCRCIITKKEDDVYVLWDGSGTRLAIRRMAFKELQLNCVIVKYMNIEKEYEGKEINSIKELEADYEAMNDGYNYRECFKYIRHKETGEIRRFDCRKLNYTINRGPDSETEYIYTNNSYVEGIHKICSYETHEMSNEEILRDWELIEPEFTDVEYDKK